MKNIELVKPTIDEYSYYEKLLSDPKTMSYNAGYDVTYDGYHYDTGCIDFSKNKWEDKNKDNNYFAYIKNSFTNKYVGYVSYYLDKSKKYNISIVIEDKYRNYGYSKDALRLLIKEAYKNGIDYLYDSFEKDRDNTLNIFLDLGFKIDKVKTWNKFGKEIEGVVVKIKTSKIIDKISRIKTIDDVFNYMKNNIRYGWKDINNDIHIGNMKEFRKLYKTMSIEETLEYGIGTCIEQVNLMHYLLNKAKIKHKMFCTRIYEPDDYNKLNTDEHMHCFVLCYINNKVYQIEHPNWERIGIHEYKDETSAIKDINEYYVKMSGGKPRPVTEFYEVEPNISFKEFNNYINSLDK